MNEQAPITYVMSATGAQVQNLAAAHAIGLDRIARLVILKGTRGGQASHADKAHADAPLVRFLECWRKLSEARGVPTLEPVIIPHDLLGINEWSSALEELVAGNAGDRVLFNYRGGTKEMSMGGWGGLQRAKPKGSAGFDLVAYEPSPPRLIWPLRNAGERMETIPVERLLPFEIYLRLCGFEIRNRREQWKHETEALRRADLTREIAAEVRARAASGVGRVDQASACIGLLTALNEPPRGTTSRHDLSTLIADRIAPGFARSAVGGVAAALRPRQLELERAVGDFALKLAGLLSDHRRTLPGEWTCDVGVPALHIRGCCDLFRYLRSGWIEEIFWLEARDAFRGQGKIAHLDMKVGRPGGPDNQHEIDVAIYAGNQLHGIETKAGISGSVQQRLDRAGSIKRSILGQYGQMLVAKIKSGGNEEEIARRAGLLDVNYASGVERAFSEVANFLAQV